MPVSGDKVLANEKFFNPLGSQMARPLIFIFLTLFSNHLDKWLHSYYNIIILSEK